MFACAVIVGHAPEMIDGNISREPLAVLTGVLTLGSVAVDGFFLLSGYLITASMTRSTPLRYLTRRVMRIYPAFIVASLLSIYVLGTLVEAQISGALPKAISKIALLRQPDYYPGQFPGLEHYPLLNGAMWTIAYEFRCYLLVFVLGICGVLRKPGVMMAITLIALGLFATSGIEPVATLLAKCGGHDAIKLLIGDPVQVVRLTSAFLVGACLWVRGDGRTPTIHGNVAAVSAIAMVVIIVAVPAMGEVAILTLGAVGLFWVSFRADLGVLQTINDRWDISYGTYLYGWPIATYIRWAYPLIDPWTLAACTVPLALLAGALSWHLIEAPTKNVELFKRLTLRQRRSLVG
ncbi:acyltransferase [Sphingomonas cynarae]